MPDYLQKHHRWWPRSQYKTRIEKTFRNLPCNIDRLSAAEHTRLHKRYPNGTPGGKPNREYMVEAIRRHNEGSCKCHLNPSS